MQPEPGFPLMRLTIGQAPSQGPISQDYGMPCHSGHFHASAENAREAGREQEKGGGFGNSFRLERKLRPTENR